MHQRRRKANSASRTKLGLVRVNSREWFHAWKLLGETTQDADHCAEHPETHEVWQYMGSMLSVGEQGWVHEFRHRQHPSDGARWLVRVAASEGWRPGDLFELARVA